MTQKNKETRNLPERFPKAETIRLSDELKPEFLFQQTHTDLLVQIAKGVIKTKRLAKKELKRRGLNRDGLFIGYPETDLER